MDRCRTIIWLVLLAVAASNAQLLMEDSAGHHFDIDSPSDEMSCYYCVNVSSNDICNRFAIERPCPTDLTVCYTQHVMDGRGKSVAVTKQCVTERTCSSQVGCRRDKSANQTICVSCCDLSYCNEQVAFNATTAVFQRSSDRTAAFSSASGHRRTRWMLLLALFAFLSSSI